MKLKIQILIRTNKNTEWGICKDRMSQTCWLKIFGYQSLHSKIQMKIQMKIQLKMKMKSNTNKKQYKYKYIIGYTSAKRDWQGLGG